MTQLKTVIWPDAPPAKPESDELTFTAKRRATEITEQMKTAAARAIAHIVPTEELREDYIIPSVFNRDVAPAVAAAVAAEANAARYSDEDSPGS